MLNINTVVSVVIMDTFMIMIGPDTLMTQRLYYNKQKVFFFFFEDFASKADLLLIDFLY